jgi:hypothetical protein
MTDPARALHASLIKPPVIDLAIVKTIWLSLFENGDMLFAPVANICKRLSQVNGGVEIMPNPEQEHLSIKLVDSADRTISPCGGSMG